MPITGFVQKFDWFSMIFQDKTTLFSKLFKVFIPVYINKIH